MTRYNVIQKVGGYDVVAATESRWTAPGKYATEAEAHAGEAAFRALPPLPKSKSVGSSTCCDCGDVVPLSPSPRGMICHDCSSAR